MMKIEAIPGFAAGWYSWIAMKNPIIRDIHRGIAQEVAGQIQSGKILDIGTGPGYVPFEIARINSSLEIIGVDLSPKMVVIAEKNAKEKGLSGQVRFQLADAARLPCEDETFDFVMSSLSWHHWAHPRESFKEIYRVLKKTGQAFIYDIWKDTPAEIETAIQKKYGWFLSFLFLTVVRSHSSISLREAEKLLSSLESEFSQKRIHTREAVLCLQATK